MPQIDERVPHQFHAVMPLLNAFESQQQSFEWHCQVNRVWPAGWRPARLSA